MRITLREVTADNYYEVGLLTTNKDGKPTFDEEYICGNAVSIAESKFYPNLEPQAIYSDEELIGFIMSGPYDRDQDNYWIMRFMIDYQHQGKGYGKKAFEAFLEQIRLRELVQELYLGLDESNVRAIQLYTSCGFVNTGVVKDGEQVYVLHLSQ
ncbi:GNAT family N-acetyltransferase [Myroides odoratimimus]|uniref:GNAT family N-acetyltransferase n=1 Tax=Myroides odoratimimus TaxID=76832 RepID=UPI0031011BE7